MSPQGAIRQLIPNPLLYSLYMPKEQEEQPLTITAIHINLKEGSIIFEAEDQAGAKQTLAAEGVIFHQPLPELKQVQQPTASLPPTPEAPQQTESAAKEKEPRVTLTGRLKNKPREGRPDRSGNPTAYARFAAHVEGEDRPHDYIATFHRHTTNIVLSLPKDAQITVDGYPHPSNSEKRLDTFSVINIVNYPGKPKKR